MKLNLTTVIKDQYGVPFKNQHRDAEGAVIVEPLTVKLALIASLLNAPDEKGAKPDDKLRRYQLYQRVEAATDVVDLKVDELALIKNLANVHYATMVYGRLCDVIEGESRD